MDKETCQNCATREGGIQRDPAIFQLFIATDWDDEVHEIKEKVSICPGYPDWKGGYMDANKMLIAAARNGDAITVLEALDHGADVHADDNCALRWAAVNGHAEVVKLLQAYA